MKQELLKGGTDALALGLVDHGRAVAPYSATIRILQGSTVLEAGTATAGAYTPSSAVTGEVHQDLAAEWTYVETEGAASKKKVELFDVVLSKLVPVISDADIVKECPGLTEKTGVHYGTVGASPSASAIIDLELVGTREDYDGALLTFLDGTLDGKQFLVTAFAAATGTITAAMGSAPSAGDHFTLRNTFQAYVDQAWSDVYDKLIAQCANDPDAGVPGGGTYSGSSRPYLIMSPDRLRRPHLLKALEKIFRDIADDTTGADWARAEYYAKEFEAVWNGLKLVFASAAEDDDPVAVKQTSAQWGFGR